MPNALLVYPEFPPSYWGMQYALEFLGKKSSMPPLGLLTVASMFPAHWQLKVVDMNVTRLTDRDLEWADYVFTSTMLVQEASLREVARRCREHSIPVVAGGPHPTTFHRDMDGIDHFVLGEVEPTFGAFLEELEKGTAPSVWSAPLSKPDISTTPLPRYDLIELGKYGSMALQFSRGCPFDCEFCDITKLFGRVARTKTNEQVLAELDQLYRLGWRGALFLVDDNFIGNKKAALELLPAVAQWQRERDYPFSFYTEASVNLARMDNLMDAMVEAGFSMTFLGIESPNPKALLKTKKKQNVSNGKEDFLLSAVRTIQAKGMEVMGGFIVGLDGDDEGVFDAQIDFIQQAGIPLAMVGLLTPIKGTDLYARLQSEGRLIEESRGDNVCFNLSYRPEMNPETLLDGYKRVLATLYDPTLEKYFERCRTMLNQLVHTRHNARPVRPPEVLAFLKSIKRQLFSRQGPAYFKFLVWTARHHPKMFGEAVRLAIVGYHLARVTSQQIAIHEFRDYLHQELETFRQKLRAWQKAPGYGISDIQSYAQELIQAASARYTQIHADFRHHVEDALEAFRETLQNQGQEFHQT